VQGQRKNINLSLQLLMKKILNLSMIFLVTAIAANGQTSQESQRKARKSGGKTCRKRKSSHKEAKMDSLSPEEKAALKGKKELVEKWKLKSRRTKSAQREWKAKKAGN
jgi:hypothetical protein